MSTDAGAAFVDPSTLAPGDAAMFIDGRIAVIVQVAGPPEWNMVEVEWHFDPSRIWRKHRVVSRDELVGIVRIARVHVLI